MINYVKSLRSGSDMKLKEYMEWKHSKKLKRRKRKNGNSRKQTKNHDYDS